MISSAEERFPDTEEVTSSILVSLTKICESIFSKVLFFCSLILGLIFNSDDFIISMKAFFSNSLIVDFEKKSMIGG